MAGHCFVTRKDPLGGPDIIDIIDADDYDRQLKEIAKVSGLPFVPAPRMPEDLYDAYMKIGEDVNVITTKDGNST